MEWTVKRMQQTIPHCTGEPSDAGSHQKKNVKGGREKEDEED